ncbi:response regulator [Larkinella ripae]
MIEDNEDQQILMKYLLKKQLQEVITVGANTSGQALDYLEKCRVGKQDFPKLILLDLHLPKREDGWELLRHLRNHSSYKHIPVVIVSYSRDLRDVEESYYWGASSYLVKPVFGEDWSDHIKSVWHQWKNITYQAQNENSYLG